MIFSMKKHIVNISFGKDSLAMLLMLIDKKYPLDEVVYFNTGMEFQAIYNLRDAILPILKNHGIKYTELKPPHSFLYYMLEKPVNKRDGSIGTGYSWCGGVCRWGTSLKQKALNSYCKGSIQYIGIAVDEINRILKNKKDVFNGRKRYPLIEWHMTEADCLKYCYLKGLNWEEDWIDLYSILDRVSCWCCSNKNLKELYGYYTKLPKYWDGLKSLQTKTTRPFKKGATIFDLEKRFMLEDMKDV